MNIKQKVLSYIRNQDTQGLAFFLDNLQATPEVYEALADCYLIAQHQRRRRAIKSVFTVLFGREEWHKAMKERQSYGDFAIEKIDTSKYKDVYNVSMPTLSVHYDEGEHLETFAPRNPYSGEEYIISEPLGGEQWMANIYVEDLPPELEEHTDLFYDLLELQDLHNRGLKEGYLGWIRGTFKDDILFVDEIQADVFQRLQELKDPEEVIRKLDEEVNEITRDLFIRSHKVKDLQKQIDEVETVEWTTEDEQNFQILIEKMKSGEVVTPEEKQQLKELGKKKKGDKKNTEQIQQQIAKERQVIQRRLEELQPKKKKIKDFSEFQPDIGQLFGIDFPFYRKPSEVSWKEEFVYPHFSVLYDRLKKGLAKTYSYAMFNTAFRIAKGKGLKYVYVLDRETRDNKGNLMFHQYYGAIAKRLGGKRIEVPNALGPFKYHNKDRGGHTNQPANYYVFDIDRIKIATLKIRRRARNYIFKKSLTTKQSCLYI